MSWFDTTGFATLAKSALNTAQKTIDRALDIKDGDGPKPATLETVKNDESFFSSFGLGDPKRNAPSATETPNESAIVTQSSSKSSQLSQSGLWGDWGTSFYNLAQQLPAMGETKMSPPGERELQPETSQPSSSSVLPPSVENEDSTVFQQPQREQLFPNEEPEDEEKRSDVDDAKTQDNPLHTRAPLKLATKVKASSESPDQKSSDPPKPETVCPDDTSTMTVSTLLAEISPEPTLVRSPTENKLLSLVTDKQPVSTNALLPDVGNDTSTSSNESAETLCEDDDEDETEEELTVMERKPPPVAELFLDLPSQCAPGGDTTATDYCVFEEGVDRELTTDQENICEQSISCSASMEVISGSEAMSESAERLERLQQEDIREDSQLSSPDSVVPIYDEPPSNLASPHFPDIRVIPSSSSYIAISLDLVTDHNMCDSDITILSPSVADSTDSENCDNKHEAEPKEVRDCETSSSGSKASNTSSSGSFVNCSLDDADPCELQREHSNSSNNNSERSSDPTGKETETSGHTSGDDIETTTSSDIEIISPPSGDNGDRCSTSPLKHMLVPRLHKIRCQAESMNEASKETFLMPVLMESDECWVNRETVDTNIWNLDFGESGHVYDTSLDPVRCRTASDFPEPEALMKRIATLQEVLNAREKSLLELNKENADMLEVNARMKSRVERLEETQTKGSEDVSKLTREFSQRLSQLESKLEETQKERDTLENELEKLRAQTSQSVSAEEMSMMTNEKNVQIAQLMQEGEKLSKQQLQLSTIIKKLRAKEKEMESTLKTQKEKIEEQSKELERLRKSMGAKDDQEKKHIDAIRQLTTSVHRLEDEKAMLKNELEDTNDKMKSMKNNMDRAYQEMTDVQRKLAEKESEIQEASLSAEVSAKENFQQQMRETQEQWEHEREALRGQASQLRITLSRVEQQAHIREEALRADIAVLQQRLQEADIRNDDLTQNISSATRPLLRQIENLQIMHSNQTISWEKLEKTLTTSLQESQKQTAVAKEEARQARDLLSSASVQHAAAEARYKALGQEKVQLASQMEVTRAKMALMEEAKIRDSSSLETIKQNFAEEITALKKEKESVIRELLSVKEELEKKKTEIPDEPLDTGTGTSGRSSPTLSVTLSHHSSVSESARYWGPEQGSESSFDVGNRHAYEAWWGGSASSMIENLQSQVKLRQGEVHQLQSEISRLDKVRESVMDDLGSMGRNNEELQAQVEELKTIRHSFQEMEQKYNTLLQMYGEKVEESEELKLDLADVKAMYRAQIDELLRKS